MSNPLTEPSALELATRLGEAIKDRSLLTLSSEGLVARVLLREAAQPVEAQCFSYKVELECPASGLSDEHELGRIYDSALRQSLLREDKFLLGSLFATHDIKPASFPSDLDGLEALLVKNSPRNLLIGSNIWASIIGSPALTASLDPTTSHENVLRGFVAELSDQMVSTDAFRHPELRVLSKNAVVSLARPRLLGRYTRTVSSVQCSIVGETVSFSWSVDLDYRLYPEHAVMYECTL